MLSPTFYLPFFLSFNIQLSIYVSVNHLIVFSNKTFDPLQDTKSQIKANCFWVRGRIR